MKVKYFISIIFLTSLIKTSYGQYSNTFPLPSGNVGIGIGVNSQATGQLQLGDIYTPGGMNLMVGDDVYLSDIDVSNTLGLYGQQNSDRATLKLGSSGPSLFGINGTLNLGTTTARAQTIFQVYEPGSSTGTWRGRIASSGDASSVVLGEYNSIASIGAHNATLSAWSNLAIQHGGGNLGIGTTSPTQKVEINGGLLQNAENIGFAIDAQPNARLGFIKKYGYLPMLASDNGNPIIFGQTNQTGVQTNLSGATVSERMRIDGNGNVGIGTSVPSTRLNVYSPGAGTTILIGNPSTSSGGFTSLAFGTSADSNGYSFINSIKTSGNSYGDLVLNLIGGNVGIGTSSPNQKLTVNGTIYGKEVKVDLHVPGPDYVFGKDYTLPSLDSVATYIEENKHLPEVPSAKDMEANGINLSEMNMLLLKKVEELTLYIIDQEKRIKTLEARK